MENAPLENLKTGDDSAQIIALLQEQNKTLHALLNFHLIKEKKAFHRAVLSFVLHAIPYLILIILGYFLYQTLHSYLETLNNTITSINNEIITIKTSVANIPTSIQASLQSMLDAIKNLNPFK